MKREMTDAMLVNLRNTGVEAMRSYYANSFNPSHEKHRPEGIPHFKAMYDKYRSGLSAAPEKSSGKYGCGGAYPPPPSHIKDARCNSSPYYMNGKGPFRHQEGAIVSPEKVSGCCPPGRVPMLSDVHNSPHRSAHPLRCDDKHSQHVADSYPYCKRSNISPHHNIPERIHPDARQQLDTRFSHAPYRSENDNYRAGLPPLYPPRQDVVEKPHADFQHSRFESYRAPHCTLPCCHDVKLGDMRRHYERRDITSPTLHSPPSMSMSTHAQGLNTRDPGETSAFSPIRPSHIRRVHSTESGYSSESNGTCHSTNSSYQELDVCNKACCAPSNHDSPTVHHKMSLEFANESRLQATNERKHNPVKDHHRDFMANEHRDFVNNNLARLANTHRGHEHESLRLSMKDHPPCGNERRPHAAYVPDIVKNEKGCKGSEEMRGDIDLNDDFRARSISGTHYHGNVKDLWAERNDRHREHCNAHMDYRQPSTEYRQHHVDEMKLQQRIKSEMAHWNQKVDFDRDFYRDPRRLPPQSPSAKFDEGDEASRTSMKAFDAHIRKMIANSRDINSINYLTKFHHSINQSNHSFTLPAGIPRPISQSSEPGPAKAHVNNDTRARRCLSLSSEPHDVKPQSNVNKHSMSQILSGNHSDSESNNTHLLHEQVKQEPPSSVQTEDKKDAVLESIADKEKDPCQDKNSCDQSLTEQAEPVQLCDSTETVKTDYTDKDHNVDIDRNSIEGDEKEISSSNTEDEEAPSPEVQCPAVDSTLNDDFVSPSGLGGLLGLTRVANEHLGQALAKEKKRSKNNNCLHLWQFLRRMLDQEQDKVGRCIEWTNRDIGEFRLIKTAVIAELWGQSKNRTCMTYEKMARAMRYYYKMNILEKVPHKRLHFRFGERILTKVLHPSSSKLFFPKDKMYEEMYRMNERNINAVYPNAMFKTNENVVSDFRNGHNYLNMHLERSKNTISYHPVDIPGMTLPSYYNEHANNHLHTAHISPNRTTNNIVPAMEFVQQQKTEQEMFPDTLPGTIIPNSVNASPGSNPSVSPYSGEETPETWSDVDSSDELIVDTDTE